jgi:hypothetical protein
MASLFSLCSRRFSSSILVHWTDFALEEFLDGGTGEAVQVAVYPGGGGLAVAHGAHVELVLLGFEDVATGLAHAVAGEDDGVEFRLDGFQVAVDLSAILEVAADLGDAGYLGVEHVLRQGGVGQLAHLAAGDFFLLEDGDGVSALAQHPADGHAGDACAHDGDVLAGVGFALEQLGVVGLRLGGDVAVEIANLHGLVVGLAAAGILARRGAYVAEGAGEYEAVHHGEGGAVEIAVVDLPHHHGDIHGGGAGVGAGGFAIANVLADDQL